MKTTDERIEEIIQERINSVRETDHFTSLDKQILKLELEALVLQAKLEGLQERKI